jgi:lysozyme
MKAKGIDVSYWQGPDIDWEQVKGAGVSYAFMRATVGLRKDST